MEQFSGASEIEHWEHTFGTMTLADVAADPRYWGGGGNALPADGIAESPVAYAEVNHGRWIAKCPFPGCRCAEMVDFGRPTYWCNECRNRLTRNRPVRLVIPEERYLIEAVLMRRPEQRFRNWLPGETIAQLEAENAEQGIS
jgi:hypothetical protein